jgi:hypothetical protein
VRGALRALGLDGDELAHQERQHKRKPVLSCGSNAAPQQLARKFPEAGEVILVRAGHLPCSALAWALGCTLPDVAATGSHCMGHAGLAPPLRRPCLPSLPGAAPSSSTAHDPAHAPASAVHVPPNGYNVVGQRWSPPLPML